MDIQKAGSSIPDSTSKPIIVTNRPILQDPMVKESASETSEVSAAKAAETSTSLSSSQKIIQPTKQAQTAAKDDESENEQPSATTETTTGIKVTDSMPLPGEEAAVVDAIVANTGKTDESKEKLAQDADEKRDQAVRTLVESKKYFVPIGQVTQARQNRQAIILLLILLVGIAGYAAYYFKLISLPSGLLK